VSKTSRSIFDALRLTLRAQPRSGKFKFGHYPASGSVLIWGLNLFEADGTVIMSWRGAAIALHYMYYNFARIHQSLRVTPAMIAGISGPVWALEEIAGLLN